MSSDLKPQQSIMTPSLLMLMACAAVVALWVALRADHENRVSDIVEAVSYAARAETARRLIVQFRAFDQIRDFWSEYAMTPVDQWRADAMIEIDHFDGLEVLAWTERDGPRFFSSGPSIALDHIPTDEEWLLIEDSLEEAYNATEDSISGPFIDDEGHGVFRLFLPIDTRDGVLVAIIDATDQIASLLEDESPGYDVVVSCCGDTELYRTGDSADAIPETWKHGGLIEPIDGVLWRVDHQPSSELASDFRPWALNTVLIVGLALAFSIGAIAYHSRRADERARAALLAEREVRHLNAALEERIGLRTRDLDDALSDLNTINLSVAHDVRNPLNTASLTAEAMLAAEDCDQETATRLERIRSSLKQISLILDRLLALSRVSSFDTERESLDLAELARQVGDELVSGDSLELRIHDLPPATLDPTMAHILLTNLISNAIRHSARDGRTIVEVGSRQDAAGVVYFVRDYGPGIDPSLREDLFRPSQKRTADARAGLGLGLAISARVLARHEGSIWVEETEGGGATFCFRLPPDGELPPVDGETSAA